MNLCLGKQYHPNKVGQTKNHMRNLVDIVASQDMLSHNMFSSTDACIEFLLIRILMNL